MFRIRECGYTPAMRVKEQKINKHSEVKDAINWASAQNDELAMIQEFIRQQQASADEDNNTK